METKQGTPSVAALRNQSSADSLPSSSQTLSATAAEPKILLEALCRSYITCVEKNDPQPLVLATKDVQPFLGHICQVECRKQKASLISSFCKSVFSLFAQSSSFVASNIKEFLLFSDNSLIPGASEVRAGSRFANASKRDIG